MSSLSGCLEILSIPLGSQMCFGAFQNSYFAFKMPCGMQLHQHMCAQPVLSGTKIPQAFTYTIVCTFNLYNLNICLYIKRGMVLMADGSVVMIHPVIRNRVNDDDDHHVIFKRDATRFHVDEHQIVESSTDKVCLFGMFWQQ